MSWNYVPETGGRLRFSIDRLHGYIQPDDIYLYETQDPVLADRFSRDRDVVFPPLYAFPERNRKGLWKRLLITLTFTASPQNFKIRLYKKGNIPKWGLVDNPDYVIAPSTLLEGDNMFHINPNIVSEYLIVRVSFTPAVTTGQSQEGGLMDTNQAIVNIHQILLDVDDIGDTFEISGGDAQ